MDVGSTKRIDERRTSSDQRSFLGAYGSRSCELKVSGCIFHFCLIFPNQETHMWAGKRVLDIEGDGLYGRSRTRI